MSSATPAFIAFSVLRHEATQQLLAKPKPWPLTKKMGDFHGKLGEIARNIYILIN
jgi:hypothetical protein